MKNKDESDIEDNRTLTSFKSELKSRPGTRSRSRSGSRSKVRSKSPRSKSPNHSHDRRGSTRNHHHHERHRDRSPHTDQNGNSDTDGVRHSRHYRPSRDYDLDRDHVSRSHRHRTSSLDSWRTDNSRIKSNHQHERLTYGRGSDDRRANERYDDRYEEIRIGRSHRQYEKAVNRPSAPQPNIVLKGRGAMKYKEKKNSPLEYGRLN